MGAQDPALLTPAEAAENAGKWLQNITTLTSASALATALGIPLALTTLTPSLKVSAIAFLLLAIAGITVAILLAAWASTRVPTEQITVNGKQLPVNAQEQLKWIHHKMLGSQIAAGIAVAAFVVAIGLSLLGDKQEPSALYLYTENMGTPAASQVLCGELTSDPSNRGIALLESGAQPVAITDQEALAPFPGETCPSADAK